MNRRNNASFTRYELAYELTSSVTESQLLHVNRSVELLTMRVGSCQLLQIFLFYYPLAFPAITQRPTINWPRR